MYKKSLWKMYEPHHDSTANQYRIRTNAEIYNDSDIV